MTYVPEDPDEGEEFTIAFNGDGFLRKIEFFIYKIMPHGTLEVGFIYQDLISVILLSYFFHFLQSAFQRFL